MREGLAFALASHGSDAASPAIGTLREGTIRWWVPRLLDPGRRPLAFLPFEELVRTGDWNGVRALAGRRAGRVVAVDAAALQRRFVDFVARQAERLLPKEQQLPPAVVAELAGTAAPRADAGTGARGAARAARSCARRPAAARSSCAR